MTSSDSPWATTSDGQKIPMAPSWAQHPEGIGDQLKGAYHAFDNWNMNSSPWAHDTSAGSSLHDTLGLMVGGEAAGGLLGDGLKSVSKEAGNLADEALPSAVGKHALDYAEEADGAIQTGGKYALRAGESGFKAGARMLGRGLLNEGVKGISSMGNPQTWAAGVNSNLSGAQFKVI